MKPVNISMMFSAQKIHIIPDNNFVKYISLEDLCKVFNLFEPNIVQELVAICKSSDLFYIYANKRKFWFIELTDVPVLIRYFKNYKVDSDLCVQLKKWTDELPTNYTGSNTIPPTENKISYKEIKTDTPTLSLQESEPFVFNNNSIYIKAENGTYYMNATQMARAYGKKPREWLELLETRQYRGLLVQKNISQNWESQVLITRGALGETWIEVNLVMEFARWLSIDLAMAANNKLTELGLFGIVTTNKDSIQRSHSTHQFKIPQNLSEALRLAADLQEQNDIKDAIIKENEHKIDFYNNFIEGRDWFKTSTIADELEITIIELYKFLVDKSICYWKKKQYCVYSKFSTYQCDAPYIYTNNQGKTYKNNKVRRWTKLGRSEIIKLWKTNHLNKT